MLAIKQAGDSVLIQVVGAIQPDAYRSQGMREGIIPIAEFRTFWDSLDHLGFWQLKNEYEGLVHTTADEAGYISASFEKPHQRKISKTVGLDVPQSCSLEFRRVYYLFDSMARFAQSTPDWKTLLGYETKEPIEGLKDRYHSAALQAVGAIRDSQDLDTLLSMLLCNDQYAEAVVGALGNIGSRRAVSALEQFLALQEVRDRSRASWDQENLALAAAKALVAVNGRQSVPAIRRYLSASYHGSLISDWSVLLASVGDYSVVPEVVQILSDSSRYRHERVSEAAGTLERTGYRGRTVISALFQAAERELKEDQPDNGTVVAILWALKALAGGEFTYRSGDSLEVKRSNLAEWLKWWIANAKRFPAGPP